VRVTLAHELTHALQDQYYDLNRGDKMHDDAALAFRSLVEGDAVVVQNAYAKTMSAADQKSYQDTESSGADQAYSNIPDILVASELEPYVVGPAFVEALKTHGGNEAINAALENPPQSTAQLLQLFDYLDQPPATGSTPTTVSPPAVPTGATRVTFSGSSSFGALQWYLLLARRIDVHRAFTAVADWAGDSSVAYKDSSGRVCIRAEYEAQSDSNAQTVAGLLKSWRAVGPDTGATIDTSGEVVHFTTCDPGTSVKLVGKDRSSAVVEYAGARIELAQELISQHIDSNTSQCTVDNALSTFSLDDIEAIDQGSASQGLISKFQQAFVTALENCR
jgi:hypothetical protein